MQAKSTKSSQLMPIMTCFDFVTSREHHFDVQPVVVLKQLESQEAFLSSLPLFEQTSFNSYSNRLSATAWEGEHWSR